MNKVTIKSMLIATLLVFQQAALAEDIDLFMGYDAPASQLPDVMIVLDNAANFSADAGSPCLIENDEGVPVATALSGTVGGIEQCALHKVISQLEVPVVVNKTTGLPEEKPLLNIGMMVYNANNIRDINNANCGGTVGGCLVQPLVPLTSANKTAFLNWIRSWKTAGGAGNGYLKADGKNNAASMQETWAYFAGLTGLSGRSYASIKPAGGCQKKYIIFVGNSYNSSGSPGDSPGPKAALEGALTDKANPPGVDETKMNAFPAAIVPDQTDLVLTTVKSSCGKGTYTFKTASHEQGGFYADEWARYLHGPVNPATGEVDAQKQIITYTIGVIKEPDCTAEYAALLSTMASLGGGVYYPTTTYDDLVLAFSNIFSKIQSVDSVFASVSLPASVGTQGTFLNQIYIGMFRPDANAAPRWVGNLKQFKLGFDKADTSKTRLKLVYDLTDEDADNANDNSAIDASTGFVDACARSYWTSSKEPGYDIDSYWALSPSGTCEAVPGITATKEELKASNNPDGPIVEKGAQGYKLRFSPPGTVNSSTTRRVYTCLPDFDSCTGTPLPFATGTAGISKALLDNDSMSDDDRTNLIDWARGANNKLEDAGLIATDMRRDVHGDVVHSRPVAINYGTADAPEVVVFYSANDGMLRAIKGNRFYEGTEATTQGDELWSFIPPEFWAKPATGISKLKRIYDNDVAVTFPGPGTNPKPYAIDGPIVAFKGNIGADAKTYIYASMRRGGRAIYALDVTDRASPLLLWKIGCPHATDATDALDDCVAVSGDISHIGQTWSSPTIITANGYTTGTPVQHPPMLILGGGYDPCEDFDAKVDDGANHECTTSTKGNRIYVLDASTGAVLNSTMSTDRSVPAGITIVNDSNGRAKYGYAADTGGNIYRISMLDAAPADWTITKIASVGCPTPSACTANRKFLFPPDVVHDLATATYHILIGSGDREKPLTSYLATASVDNFFFMIKDRPTQDTWLSSESSNCGEDVMCLASLTSIGLDSPAADETVLAALATSKGWYLGLKETEQVVTSAITISNVVNFSTHQPLDPDPIACKSNLGDARVYNINFRNANSANNTSDGSRYQDIRGDGLPPPPVGGEVILDRGEDGEGGEVVPFCIGCDPDSSLEGGTPPGTVSWTQPKSRVYWYIEQ